ncbi:hypothetical protein HYH03_017911 [Edaphochlamys debaryana]|uniref:Uncharacterized protein n=1 Tax=Edaphochlamys debaryana TaxID=47281 RepID=A0A835XFN8_9CHLO|nr:hypothetical protein HYH03_017911 [Edaphochlamys debaryana]|eukprot:KAG2483213.1 hypothetical protein HYH03_017911 [Edaphochlamys debaryana]
MLPPAPPNLQALASALPPPVRALLPAAVQLVAVMRAQGPSVECWHDPTLPTANETWWMPAPASNVTEEGWPRVLISANLRDVELLMPFWNLELLRMVAMLQHGYATRAEADPDSASVAVSVYESGSGDSTPIWLDLLTTLLDVMAVPRVVVARGKLRRADKQHRVEFLAQVRNRLLDQVLLAPIPRLDTTAQPPPRQKADTPWNQTGINPPPPQPPPPEYVDVDFRPDRLLFLNDIYTCAPDMLRLLQLNMATEADVTCGLDFIRRGDDVARRRLLQAEGSGDRAEARMEELRQANEVKTLLHRGRQLAEAARKLSALPLGPPPQQASQPSSPPPPVPLAVSSTLRSAAKELTNTLVAQRSAAQGRRWIGKRPYIVYDSWVVRDIRGDMMSNDAPVASNHGPSAFRLAMGLPIVTYCCWNGAVVFRADPFLPPPVPELWQTGRHLQQATVNNPRPPRVPRRPAKARPPRRPRRPRKPRHPAPPPPPPRPPRQITHNPAPTSAEQSSAKVQRAVAVTTNNKKAHIKNRRNKGKRVVQRKVVFNITIDATAASTLADKRSAGYPQLRFRHGMPLECDASECGLLCDDLHRLGYGKFMLDPSVRLSYLPFHDVGLHHDWLYGAPMLKWGELSLGNITVKRSPDQLREMARVLHKLWTAAKSANLSPPDISEVHKRGVDPAISCSSAPDTSGKPFALLKSCFHEVWSQLAKRVRTAPVPAPVQAVNATNTTTPASQVPGDGGFGTVTTHMQVKCMDLVPGKDQAEHPHWVDLLPPNRTAIYLAYRLPLEPADEGAAERNSMCALIPGYKEVPGADMSGGDLALAQGPYQAALFCNSQVSCTAINDDGWLKANTSSQISRPGRCLWIKQTDGK